MTNNEKIVSVIDEYIKKNGKTDEKWERSKIVQLVQKAYPEQIPSSSILPQDLCYNRCNGNDMTKRFDSWPHVFEYCGWNKYRPIGSNYPYTGPIIWNKDGVGEFTFGEWFNGRFIKYPDENRVPVEEYNQKETEYVHQIESESDKAGEIGLEKESLVKIRVNQGLFREKLMRRYDGCALCKIKEKGILIASHIKPWCESNQEEKLDVNNGFLLCPNHDKLFDQGYISFCDDGKIIISEKLISYDRILLNLQVTDTIDICEGNKKYLEYHRNTVFRK